MSDLLGEPLATPSTWLKSSPLKIKQDSFVASDKSSLNSIFIKPTILSVISKTVLAQMSIVYSSKMLVKRESTSRFPRKSSESCSTISSTNAYKCFTVNSLLVKDLK